MKLLLLVFATDWVSLIDVSGEGCGAFVIVLVKDDFPPIVCFDWSYSMIISRI